MNWFDKSAAPVKASSGKTPQPKSDSMDAAQFYSSPDTPQSIRILRQMCLERDRGRCVVSRKFDKNEANKRLGLHGDRCTDDDGVSLKSASQVGFEYLEIGHILPFRMTAVAPGDSDLVRSSLTTRPSLLTWTFRANRRGMSCAC